MVLLPRVGQGLYGRSFASMKTSILLWTSAIPGSNSSRQPHIRIPSQPPTIPVVPCGSGQSEYPVCLPLVKCRPREPEKRQPRMRGLRTRNRTERERKKKVAGPSRRTKGIACRVVHRSIVFRLHATPRDNLWSLES
ncbi:hypothetical protein GE21DRAFT_1098822 [Neurospora crassa]|nr:hypothetical protein GE21DRAFT_1098822 [Neurospora crassa]